MYKSLKEFHEAVKSIPEVEVFSESSTLTTGIAQPSSRKQVMGQPCVELDDDSYHALMKGKVPFKRWSNYIEDEETRNMVKDTYRKNKRLLIQNRKTGTLAYAK